MTRRIPRGPRCVRCRLHPALCLCRDIPRLANATEILVIMHAKERAKPTGTVRLAELSLERCRVHLRGMKGAPLELGKLAGFEGNSFLLFPSKDAVELTSEHGAGGPIRLVVPDGNWRQARKMITRDPILRALPRVKLPAGVPTDFRLRHHFRSDESLCTLEAIARALGILESPTMQLELERVLERHVDRVLFARGRIKAAEIRDSLDGESLKLWASLDSFEPARAHLTREEAPSDP